VNPLDTTRWSASELRSPDPCVGCASKRFGICQPLDAEALDEIASDADRQSLPAKAVLFREGDRATRAFSVLEGTLKLSRLLPDGRQQVVGFRFKGDLVGYAAGETYPFDAELLTAGQFCRIERGRLDSLLRRYPLLERRVLDLCLGELAATQEHLVTVARRSAEARVASFLIGLAEAHRRRGIEKGELPMPMTRGDIGDFLGLTLETVSRTFTAFKRSRWIAEPAPQKLTVLDLPALRHLAVGEPAEV
jgi:CRP/FNR family transcriptional regulator